MCFFALALEGKIYYLKNASFIGIASPLVVLNWTDQPYSYRQEAQPARQPLRAPCTAIEIGVIIDRLVNFR